LRKLAVKRNEEKMKEHKEKIVQEEVEDNYVDGKRGSKRK